VSQKVIKTTDKKSIGVIIGGSNSIFEMQTDDVKKSLDDIFDKFPNHLKYITTSRRTPKEIDTLLSQYKFDYEIVYSKNSTVNPIPDFLNVCSELFITIDSTSMLSEARASSDAQIHILELKAKKSDTKFHKLAKTIENMKTRFDYNPYLSKVVL